MQLLPREHAFVELIWHLLHHLRLCYCLLILNTVDSLQYRISSLLNIPHGLVSDLIKVARMLHGTVSRREGWLGGL